MATWGTVTLTHNPVDQVLAFAAHHRALGADRIDLYFDNPDDPAASALRGVDRVRVTLCDDAFWARLGKTRPPRHQQRQRQILRWAYRSTPFEWLFNADIDEFLVAKNSVQTVLSTAPSDQPVVQAAPFEALFDPTLPNDIFTGRQFRGEIKDPDLSDQIFGPLGQMLTAGMLSHRRGKPFLRAGIAQLIPEIHHAVIGDYSSLGTAFHPDLALLHFHADNPAQWVAAAPYRAAKGAYRFRKELQAHLFSLDTAGLFAFHRAVHQMEPAQLDLLRAAGLLVEVDLHLRDKVTTLRRA